MTELPMIVLVHGAWGSPEMWDYVIDALPSGLETRVRVADLPTCNRASASLFDDAQHVRELARDESVILVGHSYGGAVITEAGAGLRSAEHLVYVAAAMPGVGESMFDWLTKRPVPDIAMEFLDDGRSVLDVADLDAPYDEVTRERLGRVRVRPFALAAAMDTVGSGRMVIGAIYVPGRQL